MSLISSKSTIVALAVGTIIGLGVGYFIPSNGSTSSPKEEPSEKKIDYWVAPMDPNYRRDEPGQSPMGMDLIPIYVGSETESNDSGFKVSPNILSNLGVRTTPAEITTFEEVIRATGKAEYDETKTSHIHVRAEGWVEELLVRSEGEPVNKGDLLFTFYSPEIANAVSEYMQVKSSSSRLQKIALSRLNAFGLSKRAIDEIIKGGNPHAPISIYSPTSGIVASLGISEGSQIAKNTVVYEITDPSNMWMIADVYLSQAHMIAIGQSVSIEGGITSKIDYIYPDTDTKLQTVRVRVIIPNTDRKIKAGQFLVAQIRTEGVEALMVPDTAIIRLGDTSRVILSHGEGMFEAAEVKTGSSADGRTVILAGLTDGEIVVVSGQFMLDSESSFSGAGIRMANNIIGGIVTEVFSVGMINSIDIDSSRINITHPEIPGIGWPSMTMDIEAVNDIDVSELSGQAVVHFGLGKNEEGMYVITTIHPMENKE